MKKDVRTSVALCLLAATVTATAQNVPQEQTVPTPQQSAPPSPAPTPAAPVPQAQPPASQAPPPAPPPPRYQYAPAPQSPPPQQYRYQYAPAPAPQPAPPPQAAQPPSPPPGQPQWVHSESHYPESKSMFQYHPFRFHIDGGGTITQRSSESSLDNGWNAGLGLSWFPSSQLPLGLRIDGTYNEFDARGTLLNQAAATYGTRVDNGTDKMWGGDVDLELDLPLSAYVRAYLLAGGGWYRQQFTYRQTNFYRGYFCDWYGCGPGYYGIDSIVARNTTAWQFAKNAGLGLEFAMGPRTSFFVEARYLRLNPQDTHSDFLPIRAGLRF